MLLQIINLEYIFIMGVISNTVKTLGKQIIRTGGDSLQQVGIRRGVWFDVIGSNTTMTNNVKDNIDKGSQNCAGISEARDVAEGLASGDYQKTGVNAALLSTLGTSSS